MSSHTSRHILFVLTLLSVWLLSPVPSSAQMVVSDPTNLIQNTTSAVSEVTSAYQQIQAVIMQTKQLANQIQNLKQLRISNWQEFVTALNQVNAAVQRTKFVARMWLYQAKNFDRLWGKYGPPVLEAGPFTELKKQWAEMSQDAAQHNLQVQADTAEMNASHAEQLEALEAESQAVDGQLAATQLNTKTLTVLGAQQATLIDLELARANAEQTEKLEQRRKAEAARRRQREALEGGFDELDYHDPVELPDLPGMF